MAKRYYNTIYRHFEFNVKNLYAALSNRKRFPVVLVQYEAILYTISTMRIYATLKVLYTRYFFHSFYSPVLCLHFGCTFHDNHSFVNIDTHTCRKRKRELQKWGDVLLLNSVNSIGNTIYLIILIIVVWHTTKNHRQTSRRLISIS